MPFARIAATALSALTEVAAAHADDRASPLTGDSKGTNHLQLDARFPLANAWSLALHAGHTHYTSALATPLANGARDPSYSDVGATLKYQLDPYWSISGGITHATNADFYRHTASFLDASDTRNVGGSRGFLMLQGAF